MACMTLKGIIFMCDGCRNWGSVIQNWMHLICGQNAVWMKRLELQWVPVLCPISLVSCVHSKQLVHVCVYCMLTAVCMYSTDYWSCKFLCLISSNFLMVWPKWYKIKHTHTHTHTHCILTAIWRVYLTSCSSWELALIFHSDDLQPTASLDSNLVARSTQ